MKSVLTIDDNDRGIEDIRAFLRERGYSFTETSPESCAELRFTRFAIERSIVQIFLLTKDQRIIYANDAACRSLGYTREELTRMSVIDIDPWYHGLNDPELSEIWNRFRETGYGRFETNHRAKDGRVYPVEIHCNFMDFEGMEYSCCFATDISDRKLAEEKLLLRQFCVEKADTIFMQFSLDGKILMANECACRSLGYTAEELIELCDVDVAPLQTIEKKLEYSKILDANGSLTGETVLLRKDGSTFPVEFTANKLDFHSETFFVGFFRDITERRKAEEALRESEKKFRLLIETSPNAIIVIRGERIVYANHAATLVSGFTGEQLMSMEFWNFVHADFRDAARERILARMRGEPVSISFEYRLVGSRGEDKWVVAASVPMDYEGTPAILVTFADITEVKRAEEERKNLEAQLHQVQKMEAIGQFAGGVAHDFNNILTAIMGFAEVMAMRMEQGNPFEHHVRQILFAAERAADLTRGLLAFSRKQVLHVRPIELCDVVNGIRKMLRRLIPEDIDFRVKAASTGMAVMADKGQIEQVLMNLVTNARDAMPSGGVLTLESGYGVIDEGFVKRNGFGLPGRYARLVVQDTGCGMDKETQGKIFEPFFTTKVVGKGTGLGLSVTYGIVKQHNGFITVDSSPGQGTKFCVYLPLAEPGRRVAGETAVFEPSPGGNETILLVEDDDVVRDLNRTVLDEAGYTVVEASDGREALEIFREERCADVNILVTDVIMPNMDGKRLHEEIIKIRPGIKVLFMSGYSTDTLDARGILEDGYDFMSKPVMPSELLKLLRQVLDRG
jgi:PAS domain S-box-containing protein